MRKIRVKRPSFTRPTAKRTILGAVIVAALAFLVCGCGHTSPHTPSPAASRAEASARAYAATPQFRHAESVAEQHTQACVKTNSTSALRLVHCVAPHGTFPAVWHCAEGAGAAHLFTHPVKAVEAALPACVARQETPRAAH